MPIKKKVVFVVPSLKGGGAERVAVTLLEYFQEHERDIDLVLVLFDRGELNIGLQRIDIRYLDVRPAGNFLSAITKICRIIAGLARLIREQSPCTVLGFMEYSNLMCILSNMLAGRNDRVVITVHILPSDVYKNSAQYLEKIMLKLVGIFYKKASAVIAVSKGIRNDLITNFGADERQTVVIPNPIDLSRIERSSREVPDENIFEGDIPVILAVGRLTKQKGFDHMLRAFSEVCRERKAVLVIFGEGEEKKNLEALIRELGIGNSARLLGFKDNPYSYLKRSTLFVLSSLFEGFGVVLLEAMACGLPVIATRSYEGIEDIIENEKNGLLVPVADVGALVGAMERLLQDEALRNALAQEAALRLTRYRVDAIAAEYKKVLFPA